MAPVANNFRPSLRKSVRVLRLPLECTKKKADADICISVPCTNQVRLRATQSNFQRCTFHISVKSTFSIGFWDGMHDASDLVIMMIQVVQVGPSHQATGTSAGESIYNWFEELLCPKGEILAGWFLIARSWNRVHQHTARCPWGFLKECTPIRLEKKA